MNPSELLWPIVSLNSDRSGLRSLKSTTGTVWQGQNHPKANEKLFSFSGFSGTYNNQWMIVDYKMLEMPEIPTEGVLTVLEQLPGIVIIEDQTQVLLDRTYWKSYNRAFYNATFELSGAPELVSKYGDWFTYDKTPRSLIIDRDHGKIQDQDSFMDFMRYNDFENDPLARVEGCTPSQNAAGSIANRLDLNDPGMNCSFSEHDHMVVIMVLLMPLRTTRKNENGI